MKREDLKIGQTYVMKVSGKLAIVRLIDIVDKTFRGRKCTSYICINLATKRECIARSASKFRRVANVE